MEQNYPRTAGDGAPFRPYINISDVQETTIDESGRLRQRSVQEAMIQLIGRYMIGEFLIGTCGLYVQDGILSQVNQGTILLYNETTGLYTSCDLYALKFLTFFPANASVRNMPEMQRRAYLDRVSRIRRDSCMAPALDQMPTMMEAMPAELEMQRQWMQPQQEQWQSGGRGYGAQQGNRPGERQMQQQYRQGPMDWQPPYAAAGTQESRDVVPVMQIIEQGGI